MSTFSTSDQLFYSAFARLSMQKYNRTVKMPFLPKVLVVTPCVIYLIHCERQSGHVLVNYNTWLTSELCAGTPTNASMVLLAKLTASYSCAIVHLTELAATTTTKWAAIYATRHQHSLSLRLLKHHMLNNTVVSTALRLSTFSPAVSE